MNELQSKWETSDCEDADLMELGSLSLTDNLDANDQWFSYISGENCERFESGISENLTNVTANKDDVNARDIKTMPSQYASRDVGHALSYQTDVSEVNEDTTGTWEWPDEGYNSKSMSWVDGLPVRTTDTVLLMSLDAASVYSQDNEGDTGLHMAIIHTQASLVQIFINMAPFNEWLDIHNRLLQTPLHLAVITRQREITRWLVSAGASVDISDIHGNTPLHIACREGYVEIVQCLLNNYETANQMNPQDLNRRNCNGLTCLHLAALSTNLRILELLLDKGADINSRDGTSGRTILHHAAETGNRILLHFLFSQRHLDICCQTYGGLTPLRLAAGRAYDDIVRTLLVNGADDTDLDDSDNSEDTFGCYRVCQSVIST